MRTIDAFECSSHFYSVTHVDKTPTGLAWTGRCKCGQWIQSITYHARGELIPDWVPNSGPTLADCAAKFNNAKHYHHLIVVEDGVVTTDKYYPCEGSNQGGPCAKTHHLPQA